MHTTKEEGILGGRKLSRPQMDGRGSYNRRGDLGAEEEGLEVKKTKWRCNTWQIFQNFKSGQIEYRHSKIHNSKTKDLKIL